MNIINKNDASLITIAQQYGATGASTASVSSSLDFFNTNNYVVTNFDYENIQFGIRLGYEETKNKLEKMQKNQDSNNDFVKEDSLLLDKFKI
jgi:hypothetical protein